MKEILNRTNQNSVAISINQAIFSEMQKASVFAGEFLCCKYFFYG